MLGVANYGGFVLGAALIVLLPGPNSMYVLTTAARHGVGAGYRSAVGVFFGDLVLMVASVGGAASLLRSHPSAFHVVKYLGAGYLAWIGIGLVRSGIAILRERSTASTVPAGPGAPGVPAVSGVGEGQPTMVLDAAPDRVSAPDPGPDFGAAKAEEIAERAQAAHPGRGPFLTALVLSVLNPKAILFFVAFFVQFVTPTDPHPVATFLVLALTMQVLSVAYLSSLIFGGSFLAARFRRHRRAAGVGTATVGAVFVAFGAKLATTTLR
ncbi:MAG: LysE family transporter [Nostocoides sp.]